MTIPPHDPSSYPSPGAQGQWGQPAAPQAAPGAPSPAPQRSWAPADAAAPGQGAASGPAPGTDLAADLGAALSFSGVALLRNPVTYLVSGLIYCAIYLLIIGGGFVGGIAAMIAVMGDPYSSDSDELLGVLALYGVLLAAMLVAMPFALVWQSGSARAAEIVREGGRPTLGQAMVGPMRVILTALLYGAIVLVGMLLLYIPGLIAAVLFMFSVPAAIRGASPVEALKESFTLVKNNLGTAIVGYLVLMVAASIGSTIIVGVLVLTPFMMLFELGLYERLNGRRLPEPAKA